MFLFKPHHVDMIKAGTKTQTRRNHKAFRAKVGAIHQVRTELFGKPHCHIKVLRRWVERVRDISKDDANAEGGYSREDYIKGLCEMHKGKLTPDSVVKCYEFELVEG